MDKSEARAQLAVFVSDLLDLCREIRQQFPGTEPLRDNEHPLWDAKRLTTVLLPFLGRLTDGSPSSLEALRHHKMSAVLQLNEFFAQLLRENATAEGLEPEVKESFLRSAKMLESGDGHLLDWKVQKG